MHDHTPRVHITDAPLAGAVHIAVQHDGDDDARGGRLTLPRTALYTLPRVIEAAVARYREETRRARGDAT